MNNILRALELPWLARVPTWRASLTTALIWLVLSAQVVRAVAGLNVAEQIGVVALIVALGVVWSFIANVMWLARDATHLRLPKAARETDRCLALYALLTLLIPALLLGAAFGRPATWLAGLALVAMVAWGLRLLPILLVWIAVAAFVGWIILLKGALHIPLPGQPGFVVWAGAAALVVGAIALQRWFALRDADFDAIRRWLVPGELVQRAVQMKQLGGDPYATRTPASCIRSRARRPSLSIARRIGPRYRIRATYLAINAVAAPRAQRTLHEFALVGMFAIVALVVAMRFGYVPAGARWLVAQLPPIFGIIVLSGLGNYRTMTPLSRWSGAHAELPLLALLPGMGSRARQRRTAVLACLRFSGTLQGYLLIATALVTFACRMPGVFYLLLVSVAAAGLALNAALATRVLAGTPPHAAARVAYKAVVFVLYVATVVLLTKAIPDWSASSMTTSGLWMMAIAIGLWVAWSIVVAGIAWRGWRLLQRRPHPFLANPVR